MKKALENIVLLNENTDPKSEPGKCKYKMKVSLADELNQLIQERSSSIDKENVNKQEENKPKVKPLEAVEMIKSVNKSIGKELKRSVSRAELGNHHPRMIRSDSEVMRQSFGDIRTSVKTEEFAYRSLFRNFDKKVKALKLPNFLREENICDILTGLGFLPNQISAEDQAMVGTVRYMLGGSNKGITINNFFLFLMIICNINPEIH